jgi:hypothetical protein
MPDPTPTADELREAARHTEKSAAQYAGPDTQPPLEIGDAQNFPRENPDGRAVRQASVLLHEKAAQASATLLLLAEIMDDGTEVPSPVLAEMRPYVEAYRDEQEYGIVDHSRYGTWRGVRLTVMIGADCIGAPRVAEPCRSVRASCAFGGFLTRVRRVARNWVATG